MAEIGPCTPISPRKADRFTRITNYIERSRGLRYIAETLHLEGTQLRKFGGNYGQEIVFFFVSAILNFEFDKSLELRTSLQNFCHVIGAQEESVFAKSFKATVVPGRATHALMNAAMWVLTQR